MSYLNAPASEGRIRFINTLLAEREVSDSARAYTLNLIASGISTQRAIDAIEYLKGLPKAGLFDAPKREGTPVTEEGFYLHEGAVYRVVTGKNSGRLYAKKSTPSGWDYEAGKGVIFRLRAEDRMSGEAIAAFGVEHEFCVVCSTGFSDPTSHHIGIGPKCGVDVMGADAYKALRLSVADRPDVVAFEAAKKARAKEAREAKKREQAQLVLAV